MCDWLANRRIPTSTSNCCVVRPSGNPINIYLNKAPVGKTFITGLA